MPLFWLMLTLYNITELVGGGMGSDRIIRALLLSIVIIGLPILFYMLVSKPAGILTVVYEQDEDIEVTQKKTQQVDETKDCPMCAEKIKLVALKCRFCNHVLTTKIENEG